MVNVNLLLIEIIRVESCGLYRGIVSLNSLCLSMGMNVDE